MSELLNLIGLSSGIALYAMLLVMVVRADRASAGQPLDPLLLAMAVLGLLWNLCALPAYELPNLGIPGPFPLLVAIGYSALGFLPAVVVHSVLRGEYGLSGRWLKRAIAITAYAVSAIAALLHLRALWTLEPLPSVFAMRLLTYTFILLVVPLAIVTRGQPGARRALWAAALSAFAVSALHLGQLHHGDSSWPIELMGHHASLPLALAILYQDFPFALADLFLKRALTLLTLVAVAFAAVVSLGVTASGVPVIRSARDVGLLVTLWVATTLLYPKLRNVTAWFVDAVVLDRPNYPLLRAAIAQTAERHEDIDSVLDEACKQLAPALSARSVRWLETTSAGRIAQTDRRDAGTTIVDIPVAEPPRFALEVAGVTGGRRLLSDDHAAIDGIAALLGRRIDAIRLARERYQRQLREQEMATLATEAELRALRAQINPHFLFNALTTIGYLIQTAPERALDTLMRLTALLRAALRSDGETTTLGREIELVESYLDIERARFENRLRVRMDVPSALRAIRVPALILQPIVENAVKHGIGPLRHGGEISVTARVGQTDRNAPMLSVVVQDSGAGASPDALRDGRQFGVGLSNVERRLACQYGSSASLSVTSAANAGTRVEIRMPAEQARTAPALAVSGTAT
jgi:two-component system LytT family sensor kinase